MENVSACAQPRTATDESCESCKSDEFDKFDEFYEYSVVSRTMYGEQCSGDAALVQATADGALVAVVDGLGHGDEAAVAASAAIKLMREHAGEPVPAILQRCHEALQQTRGAALSLVALDARRGKLSWCGVGNVEAIVTSAANGPLRNKRYLTNCGGVVGYRMPAVRDQQVSLHPGDLLILATDGIDSRFVSDDIPAGEPHQVARAILERHGKASDDALVLVLRWLGENPDGSLLRRKS